MSGTRVPRRDPVRRRLHPLGHPGSGRAADVEEPRHRDRPARADRLPRRRRPPLRPAGDVVEPGRALLGGEGPAGPRPRQQALERLAADPAQRRRRRARRRPPTPSRTAGSSRGWSGPSSSSASASTPSTSPTPRSSSTGSSTRSSATGTSRSSSRALYDGPEHGDHSAAANLLHVLGRTLAMAHPLMPFVTEEIWSYMPGRELGADRRALPGGRPRARFDAAAEAEVGGRDRADPLAAALARARRRRPGVGAARPRPATRSTRSSLRLARIELDGAGVRRGRRGGRRDRDPALRGPRPGGGRGADRGAARAAPRRGQARRGQARATRSSSPTRPPTSSTASARSSSATAPSSRSSADRPRAVPGRARAGRLALRAGADARALRRARLSRSAATGRCTSSAPTASRR